jgi:hypothetical protein
MSTAASKSSNAVCRTALCRLPKAIARTRSSLEPAFPPCAGLEPALSIGSRMRHIYRYG